MVGGGGMVGPLEMDLCHSKSPASNIASTHTHTHTHTRREETKDPSTNPLWIDRQAGQGTGR